MQQSMHDNPYQAPTPFEATLVGGEADSAEDARRAASLLRVLLALYGLLSVATIAASFALERFLPEDLQLYLEWEAEADPTPVLLAGAAVAIPTVICILTAWIGMFFFWRPSRWLFLAAHGMSFVVICLFGPYVSHGVEYAIDFTGQLIAGAILAMAYFSPASRLFARRSKPL
jgi:hypothetical protein